MENNKETVDLFKMKEIISGELSQMSEIANGEVTLPEIVPEKNEIKACFPVKSISKEQIIDCLVIIKNHIENIRITTFEPNYYSFQALNENLFDNKSILDNIKFRFYSFSKTECKVEIIKKGEFNRDEIFVLIQLFKYLHSSTYKKNMNPKEILQRLGIQVFDPQDGSVLKEEYTFDLVAGYTSVKREIQESIIYPVQNPLVFDEVAKLTRKFPQNNRPRAVLFEGEPGVGKTTMAKIVSCLCNIPLVYVPIESIMSKYYGESSQNLALVFDAAGLFPSSLVFLDEIDSLAGSRDDSNMAEATRKLLSVLLRKLDGFEGKPGSITIGATNRKQDLDKALLSRFDKSIYFPLPDLQERAAILHNYAMHLDEKERVLLSEKMGSLSGRNIKDFCDYVERKWASKIVENKDSASPPPIEIYYETITPLFQDRQPGLKN